MLRSLRPAWQNGTGTWRRDPARWSVLLVLSLAAAGTGAWAALLMLPPRPHPAAVVEPPVEVGSWSVGWGRTMQRPAVEQAFQLEVLTLAATAAALLACAVAWFAGSLLWRQRVALRREEYLLARAVGAQRRHVLASLAGEAWPWAIAVAVGSAGLTVLVALLTLVTFPGEVRVGAGLAAGLLAPLALAAVMARVESGGLRPVRRSGWAALGAFGSPMVAIVALGFAALSGSWLLQRHGPGGSAPDGAPSLSILPASILNVGEGGRAAELERWQRGLAEGGTRAGFASAGTTRGTGVRLQAIIDCGACAQGGLPLPVRGATVSMYAVAPDTFAHLGRSLVRGRDFGWDVDHGAASVAIVNRALATDHFEGGVAIGRRLRFGNSDWLTVVGVVSDPPRSFHGGGYEVWLPIGQALPGRLEVLADGSTGVEGLVRAAAPAGAQVRDAVTLREVFGVQGWFAAAFGVLAPLTVLLVALGAWTAARSEARAATHEAGVRLAVGARHRDVMRFLVGAVARRLALALALGAWLALFLGAGLHHLPGAVPQFDPAIWLASAIVLTLVVVAASLPAWRRILRITPTIALDGSE